MKTLFTRIKAGPFLPILVIVGIVLGLWIRLIMLNHVTLQDWDESIYAQVAREWRYYPSLTLFYNRDYWFEKPPLLFAIIGTFYRTFGFSEFTARLPSLIAGVGVLLCILRIVQQETKSRWLAICAALLAFSTSYLIERSNLVNVDIFLTLGWLIYLLSPTNIYTKLLGTVIGVWTKSFLGLIPLCLDIIIHVIKIPNTKFQIPNKNESKNLKLKTKNYTARYQLSSIIHHPSSLYPILELCLIGFIALAWHWIMYVQYGNQFIQSHIYDHLLSRVTRPIELHFGDKYFYVMQLWINYGYLLLLAAASLIWWIWEKVRSRTYHPSDFTYLVSLGYFALLTISKSKLEWYVVPLIPLVAIHITSALARLPTRWRIGVVAILIMYAASRFIMFTYLSDFSHSQPPDNVKIAQCRTYLPHFTHVAYLADPQSRKDAHVLEAAQLLIGSSLIYGGSPSFLFYVNEPVTYYYSIDKLEQGIRSHDAIVFDRADEPELTKRDIPDKLLGVEVYTPLARCERGSKVMITR